MRSRRPPFLENSYLLRYSHLNFFVVILQYHGDCLSSPLSSILLLYGDILIILFLILWVHGLASMALSYQHSILIPIITQRTRPLIILRKEGSISSALFVRNRDGFLTMNNESDMCDIRNRAMRNVKQCVRCSVPALRF